MAAGKLILLPNLLDDAANWQDCMPANLPQIIETLDGIFGESEKQTRRYLSKFVARSVWEKIKIQELNEHTKQESASSFLKSEETWGLVSDAGLPCIADPGSWLVLAAQKEKIAVEAVVGPCSITLSLQLSGLEGQRFSFHGYLPREQEPLKSKILDLQRTSKKENTTQIFIETPYRNQKMFQTLLETLQPKTFLCIAQNLTGALQKVRTQTVAEWKKGPFELEKTPTIFLFLDS